MNLDIRPATAEDANTIITIVNQAYRGPSSRQGWTTEADLIDGLRIDIVELNSLQNREDTCILLARQAGQALGCILLEYSRNYVQLGMLAVLPTAQNQGIGAQLLTSAESLARSNRSIEYCVLWVIPSRSELIAYYERRGYRKSAVQRPFPSNPRLWQAKVDGLALQQWIKYIQ